MSRTLHHSNKNKVERKIKHGKSARLAHAFRRHANLVHEEYGDERIDDAFPIHASLEIIDWLFDQARRAADGDLDAIEKVESVRSFAHASLAGHLAFAPSESDVLSVLALAVVAIERRHGIRGLSEQVAAIVDQSLGAPPVAPAAPICPPLRVVPRVRRAPRLTPHLYCMP